MRRRFTLPVSHAGKINVTPLIDVVMCLIIFYLLVGRLAMDRQAGIKLPGSTIGVEDKGASSLIINVMMPEGSAAARVVIDGRTIDDPTLKERLSLHAGASPESAPLVQIRADRRLPYASVSPVLAACRDAGLKSVLLTTQREEGRP